MPKIEEMVKDRSNKKFVKKNYRPWDLTGVTPIISLVEPSDNIPAIISHNELSKKTDFPTTPQEIDINLDNTQVTIEQQPDNIQISNREHLDNIKKTSQITNGEQLDINLDPTTLSHQLMKLSGIQKIILNFIIDFCTFRNSLETGPIETAVLATYAKATIGVIKISLKRLIDKGFVIRNQGKQAKGGYINLSITSEIYNSVIEQRKKSNNVINPTEFINTIRYQIDNNDSYNSSYNKNTITKKIENIPNEWLEINFDSLNSIGFNKTQIKQLIDKNEPALVQESINHFAFGLEYNPKFKKYEDPLNVLMGVLRKGQGWFEKNYRSPKEIAQQQLLEIKKGEIARKKEMEEEAYKIALTDWQQNLSPDDLETIAPAKKTNGEIMPQSAKISLYFKENVWPNLKAEYLVT